MVPRNSGSKRIRRWRLSRYRQQNTSCSRSRRRALRKSRVACGLASSGPVAQRLGQLAARDLDRGLQFGVARQPQARLRAKAQAVGGDQLLKELKLPSTSRATCTAECPRTPVRSRIASSSASDRASAPCVQQFLAGTLFDGPVAMIAIARRMARAMAPDQRHFAAPTRQIRAVRVSRGRSCRSRPRRASSPRNPRRRRIAHARPARSAAARCDRPG